VIPLQAIPDRWRALIALLGEHPLECHETHLSVVYLTARYAVKFKKAVNFGFVDYRTSEARALCACDELQSLIVLRAEWPNAWD
jgi:aminoglycoside phosphotransferase family enzyme